MEGAAGHVVVAAFFQRDARTDDIDYIDAAQQVINKRLGDLSGHAVNISLPQSRDPDRLSGLCFGAQASGRALQGREQF